jgi:hypothetical protein
MRSHDMQVEQDVELPSITLEVEPLSEEGAAVRVANRVLQEQMRPSGVPHGALRSVAITSTFQIVGRQRSNPPRRGRTSQPLTELAEVHARPFDIYVEFGLGARIMKLFGTVEAKEISRASPLTSNYKAHVHVNKKATQRHGQVEDMARARAAMHANEP